MDGDKLSLGASLKAIGIFLTATGILGGALVTFVVPGNQYFTGAALLLLGMAFVCGVCALVLGLFLTWQRRGVFTRALAMPAALLARILGR